MTAFNQVSFRFSTVINGDSKAEANPIENGLGVKSIIPILEGFFGVIAGIHFSTPLLQLIAPPRFPMGECIRMMQHPSKYIRSTIREFGRPVYRILSIACYSNDLLTLPLNTRVVVQYIIHHDCCQNNGLFGRFCESGLLSRGPEKS